METTGQTVLSLCSCYFIKALAHLSVDAALDGPAVYGDVFLFVIQSVAFGHPDHLLHQVQPSNALSYGMLHLSEEPGGRRVWLRQKGLTTMFGVLTA